MRGTESLPGFGVQRQPFNIRGRPAKRRGNPVGEMSIDAAQPGAEERRGTQQRR